MRTRCQYHCRACDGHFSSLNAFDSHRTGPATGRECIEPLDDERFEAKTGDGTCGLQGPVSRPGITVWALGRDLERGREYYGATANPGAA